MHNDYQRNIQWKIKSMSFDNMFSYGEENEVDFRKLDGIVGLFSPNASGKSSLLDILSFCLFDTSSRAFKAANVLNNRKNNFYCKVNFEIDDTDYFVERKGRKLSNGHVKVDVNFWMIDETGEEISLNGDQRRTTNDSIRNVIGTYEDFVLTTLSLQNNNTVFIDKTQKERKDLLSKFIGIGIFDDLWRKAADEISDVSAVLRRFNQRDYDKELTDTQDNLNQYTLKYDKLVKQKEEWLEEYDQLNTDIIDTTKKLKSLDESAKDIDSLNNEYIIFVVSTTGNGDIPTNGERWWKFIKNRKLDVNYCNNIKFELIALGDSNYNEFCGAGKKIYKRLKQLKAESLHDMITIDDVDGDYEEKINYFLNLLK